MRKIAGVFFILLIILSGCTTDSENKEWEVSPLFKSGYTMIGKEGRLGFIYDDSEVTRFYPNKKQKYMWHFWGQSEELQGPLKITGTSKETGELITVFSVEAIGGSLNGADGHIPSIMSLPSPGLWKLETYFGGKLFDSITVQVHEQK